MLRARPDGSGSGAGAGDVSESVPLLAAAGLPCADLRPVALPKMLPKKDLFDGCKGHVS